MPAKPRYCKNDKWNTVCRQFIDSQTNQVTRDAYAKTLKRFIAFAEEKHGKPITPDKITTEDITQFLRRPTLVGRNKGQPPSAYSYNTYLMSIKSFYNFCTRTTAEFRGKQVPLMREEKLPTNGISMAKTGDVDRDMTESEVRSFLLAIDRATLKGKRNYALFTALLATGRRRFEITLLRRGDLEPWEFDGGKKGWRFWFRAKKRTTREYAEMPPKVMGAIIAYHQAAGRDFATMPEDQALFPGTETRRKPMALANVSAIFRQYARAAGVPENAVPHSLRWENAYQRYLANGNDLIKTQEEMGWRTVEQAAHYIRRKKRKNAGDASANSIADKFAI